MLRYAITSLRGADAQAALLEDARRWAAQGVEFVQLREKQLGAGEQARLARSMVTIFRHHGESTKLLVNGRADIAVAAGADGVHLTSRAGELLPQQVLRVFAAAGAGAPIISVSCHAVDEVQRAAEGGANLILFGPVFEKRADGAIVVCGVGLEALRRACEAADTASVLALGGITAANASLCIEAGAAGIAGIRLFAC